MRRLVQQRESRLLDCAGADAQSPAAESRDPHCAGQGEHQHVLQHRIEIACQGVRAVQRPNRVATVHERFRGGHPDVCLRVLQQCRESWALPAVATSRHGPCRQC